MLIYERGGTDDFNDALPKREGDAEDLTLNSLKPGDVFIDVGANIGHYTILASKLVGANGKVFVVEHIPQTMEILKIKFVTERGAQCNIDRKSGVEYCRKAEN